MMDPRIDRALAGIHAGLRTPLSVPALARAANLSESRFAHLFRREVGTSPARYIHALRMLRARVLIERTSLSIKEVMAQVGCHDPSHFTRDFRDFHGLAPRDWRRAAAQAGRPADAADAFDSASVTRIADLANKQRKRPTKPVPRARAPDLALHSAG